MPGRGKCASATMRRRSIRLTPYLRNGSRAVQLKDIPPPYVPGMEAAGVVDEVGAGVIGLKVGDAVLAIVVPKGGHSAYREQLVLDARSVALAPNGRRITSTQW